MKTILHFFKFRAVRCFHLTVTSAIAVFIIITITVTANAQNVTNTKAEPKKQVLHDNAKNSVTRNFVADKSVKSPSPAKMTQEEMLNKFKPSQEIVEKRDRMSRHFRNDNGTFTAVISSGNSLNYEENGVWKSIKKEITTNNTGKNNNYAYANTENAFKTYYPSNSTNNGLRIEFNEGNLDFWLNPGMCWMDNNKSIVGEKIIINEVNANVNSAQIEYVNAFSNSSVTFTQGLDEIKMEIILNDNSVFTTIPQNAAYLTYYETIVIPSDWKIITEYAGAPDNSNIQQIMFFDGTGTNIAKITAPVIYEENAQENNITGTYLIEQNENTLTISTIVPVDWLTSDDRTFPVVIDPSIQCDPNNAANWTGRVEEDFDKFSGNIYEGRVGFGGNSKWTDGWAKYNISAIPDAATIIQVEHYYTLYQSNVTNGLSQMAFVDLFTDPVPTGGAALYAAIEGWTNFYNAFWADNVSFPLGSWFDDLGSQGCIDLQSQLAADWFAIGWWPGGTWTNNQYQRFSPYSDVVNHSYIMVVYCVGAPPPNDNCASVSPVTLTECNSVQFTGDNTCATNECDLAPGGHTWHAFTINSTMDVELDYCGTGPPSFDNYFVSIIEDCPCTSFIDADSWESTSCGDGNGTITWLNLPAGTYYYAVLLDPASNAEGPYTLNVVAYSAPCPELVGDAYGVYSESAIAGNGGNVEDCEIYAEAGTGGVPPGEAFLVAEPTDAGHINDIVSIYPVIQVDNISCENSNMDFSTTDAIHDWNNFGTGSVPASSVNSPETVYYTSSSRKTINFEGDAVAGSPPVNDILLDEDFESGGAGWTVWKGGSCSGGWETWTLATGCDWDGVLAIINSDGAGSCDMDEELESPEVDATGYTTVTLEFEHYFYRWTTEIAEVDVWDGAVWQTVYEANPGGNPNDEVGTCGGPPDQQSINITAYANAALKVRFHYYNANYEYYWWVDNVRITGNIPAVLGLTQPVDYTGFVNIVMPMPSEGEIFGPDDVCPGTYNYASSEAGTPGYAYQWSVLPGAGVTITAPNSSSTDIDFTNANTYTVSLLITSECCGPLAQIDSTVVVNPLPPDPPVPGSPYSICIGGSIDLEVDPTTPGYNYIWYDAPNGGTQLGTGPIYTVDSTVSGVTNYYVEAVSDKGCVSASRTLVVLTGTDSSPTTAGGTDCAPGLITVSVTGPIAGATYNWYDAAVGGNLLQTGGSYTYDVDVPGPAPNSVDVWVSVVVPGCSESSRTMVTATLSAASPTTDWTGVIDNDWFKNGNWSDCVPRPQTDATIPSAGVFNECEIWFANGGTAETKNITIESGRTLTFGDLKAILDVYGNWDQDGGDIDMNGQGKVLFTSNSANQTFRKVGTASGNFYLIQINNTFGTVTILDEATAKDMTIRADGQLMLTNGVVVTNGNRAVVVLNTDSTSVTDQSANSYIDGVLRRAINATGSYDFPVGNSTSYQLFNLGDPQNISGGFTDLTVSFDNPADGVWSQAMITENGAEFDTILDNGDPDGLPGVWTLTENAGTADYDLTLYGRNFNTFGDSAFTVAKRTAPGNDWALDGIYDSHSETPGLITVTRTGYSGFSQVGIASSTPPYIPLPIGLLSFNAVCKDNQVELNWVTASEINNDYFTLEKTSDLETYEQVAIVDGAGNSSQVLYYTLIDEEPYDGISYYRLKQTDFDGNYKYFDLAAVDCEFEFGFSIRPNPAKNELEVLFNEVPDAEALIKMYDVKSKLVYSKHHKTIQGSSNKIEIDISAFSKGMYFVTLTVDMGVYQTKFVKE